MWEEEVYITTVCKKFTNIIFIKKATNEAPAHQGRHCTPVRHTRGMDMASDTPEYVLACPLNVIDFLGGTRLGHEGHTWGQNGLHM